MSIRLVCVFLLAWGPGAFAQTRLQETDSPRAALQQFLDLTREGDYDLAASHLELPSQLADRGPQLARRLKAVLDRHVWFDLTRISGKPEGNGDDGLPPELEEIARLPSSAGTTEPVLLLRARRGEALRWLFAQSTVERIDPWYGQLSNAWLLEHLPEVLLKPGPRELLRWQWLALALLLVLALLLGRLLAWVSRSALGKLASRTAAQWDDAILLRLGGPLTVLWALAALYLALPQLSLYPPATAFIQGLMKTALFVTFFWSILRSVEVVERILAESPWAKEHPASRSLVPLAAKVSKVAIAAIAAVAVISDLGYPVGSLLAGLGIGGLALALAGQKTVEHLFGAFSIGLDQPFRQGDFVRVEDFVGTVEQIGLRSTRFRTLDRTVISLPNGKLSEMRLETFAERDRVRLSCTLGVVYGTTASQMKEILEGLHRVLREHSKIWPDEVVVHFAGFGASSLDIEVMAWFQCDWAAFRVCRQEVLLAFMEVVEKAGSSFAFPTSTVHLVPEKPAP